MPQPTNADLMIVKVMQWANDTMNRCKAYGNSAYSQSYRYAGYSGYPKRGAYLGHEAYDCASFVWYSLYNAGFPILEATPGHTPFAVGYTDSPQTYARMMPTFKNMKGWQYFTGLSGVRKGDVLINWGNHTELAISSTKTIGAGSSNSGIRISYVGNNFNGYYRYIGDDFYHSDYTPETPLNPDIDPEYSGNGSTGVGDTHRYKFWLFNRTITNY